MQRYSPQKSLGCNSKLLSPRPCNVRHSSRRQAVKGCRRPVCSRTGLSGQEDHVDCGTGHRPASLTIASTTACVVALGALLAAAPASAASQAGLPTVVLPDLHHLYSAIGPLASEEDFWSNVGRYISYFFSVLLGTAYTAAKPVANALRKPGTAVVALAAIGLLVAFLVFTVKSMLGLQDLGLQNAGGIS